MPGAPSGPCSAPPPRVPPTLPGCGCEHRAEGTDPRDRSPAAGIAERLPQRVSLPVLNKNSGHNTTTSRKASPRLLTEA